MKSNLGYSGATPTRRILLSGLVVIGVLAALALSTYRNILAPPPSVALRAFGDQKAWIVLTPMRYPVGDSAGVIEVPAGFVTDFASIPPEFWGPPLYLTPTGQYGRAAIVHDYLYWAQKCTRDQADRLLVIAMKESRVGTFDQNAIYAGVSLGGSEAWAENARLRTNGFPRVIPEEYREPADPNLNWPEYAGKLVATGVKSLEIVDDGHYCKLGNSFDVPLAPNPVSQRVRVLAQR